MESQAEQVQCVSSEKEWEYILIDAYEDEECLWHISATDYRNKQKRQNALKRISDKINKPVEIVKKKIDNLRSYYNKELAKVKNSRKSGAGSDDIYCSKWPHFDNLDRFLRSQVVSSKTTSNLDAGENEGEDDLEEGVSDANDSMQPDDTEQPQPNTRSAASLFGRNKKKRKPDDELIQQATDALRSMSSMSAPHKSHTKAQMDEFDVFGQHVANELRLIQDFRARMLSCASRMHCLRLGLARLRHHYNSPTYRAIINIPR